MNIPIVYEDQWLCIVDKPSGLLVIPTAKKESRTLTGILNDFAKEKGLPYRYHPCHRLDRETSGLTLYAKGKAIQQKMMDVFKNRGIKKMYIAFVQGHLRQDHGQINEPIERSLAVTRYRVVERRSNFSIVEVVPLTGRTNQIRIHFAGLGHPLVGESKFAFRRYYALKAKRLCLHASDLEFTHPVTKETVSVELPLPQDLQKFLEKHV